MPTLGLRDIAPVPATTHRDRAILGAVAAGRCAVVGSSLLVDGRRCADQFAAARLQSAGWLVLTTAADLARAVPAELTAAGAAQLVDVP